MLPTVRETVNGRVTARDIRDLSIEDLLGRQQVEMDDEAVRGMLAGRRVLITGAGGSIGSEIVRQVLMFEPAKVLLLDHDETHLHDVMSELDPSRPVSCALADVRDRDRVLEVFWLERPDVVFHAAAHKHVPMLEDHPAEAFRTNVLGTANVVEAASAVGVGRFVLVSTDKAVRPDERDGRLEVVRGADRPQPAGSRIASCAPCGSATCSGAGEASSRRSCGRSPRAGRSPSPTPRWPASS